VVGIAGLVASNVSKAALISLTQSMALDFAAQHLRVNCVCPGTTLTPLVEEAVARESDPAAALERLGVMRPLGRLGRALAERFAREGYAVATMLETVIVAWSKVDVLVT